MGKWDKDLNALARESKLTENMEPRTDFELIERLTTLYAAGDTNGKARDDFWDTVSFHIGWILKLATAGATRSPAGFHPEDCACCTCYIAAQRQAR
jgi:hypothetical protein